MLVSGVPYKFQYSWGQTASGGFITTPIPATTGSTVRASQTLGFPPGTAGPTGTPPDVRDWNGAFSYQSLWAQWQQAGGPIYYDATFSGWIGGYPNGATLNQAGNPGSYWQSTVDNNTSDPDTGGANWIAAPTGRLLNIQVFTSSGTYTPTPGMALVMFEVQGDGGGSAGVGAQSSGQFGFTSGGGAGTFARVLLAVSDIGASQAITVGPGGAAGTNAPGSGGAGTGSAVGSLIVCPGGTGSGLGASGVTFSSANTTLTPSGGIGGGAPTVTAGTLIFSNPGQLGTFGIAVSSGFVGSKGGCSFLGVGGYKDAYGGTYAATLGGGAAGVYVGSSGAGGPHVPGLQGAPGIVIAYEYS